MGIPDAWGSEAGYSELGGLGDWVSATGMFISLMGILFVFAHLVGVFCGILLYVLFYSKYSLDLQWWVKSAW